MAKERQKAWKYWSIFMKGVLLFGVGTLIVLLFPNNVKFKYQFERGQPWRYEELVAPFDFPIKKAEEELVAERDELLQNFSPYYELDYGIGKTAVQQFKTEFQQQLQQSETQEQFQDVTRRPDAYREFGTTLLNKLFNEGIVKIREEDEEREKEFVIQIVKGGFTERQTLEQVIRPEDARDFLGDTLPYSQLSEPEFLFPILENTIRPNVYYSDTLTQRFKEDLLAGVVTSRGRVSKGELIIPKGGVVTDEIYQKLLSFREQYEKEITEKQSSRGVLIGYIILTFLLLSIFVTYLQNFAPEVFNKNKQLVFVALWLVAFSYLTFLVEKSGVLSPYLIPFGIVPIVIKAFYTDRLALFVHLIIVLFASFITSQGYEFTFIQILVGIIVVLSNIDTRNWSRFFYSMLFIFLTYALSYVGLELIRDGSLRDLNLTFFAWTGLNVLLTLLAYPLIPLFERFFSFISPITLIELSDLNRPLLQKLATKAPGTLQHSLQVANLSEAAAREIGADHLLVKVAALYHDIGKTLKPEYFIENQSGQNPHEDIDDLTSAKTIIEHVTEGVKIAQKAKLPDILINFIKTHHGTTKVEYFYRKHLKEHPDSTVDESEFRYPGPLPRTKEETIMMLADSIEAACKSLKDPTEKELMAFIDKIIQHKATQGQLDDSAMTFKELEACTKVFKKIMRSVHHLRIEYPEEEKQQ
ncbi:phosphohydrolase [Flavilitoribacter nigricans DSM 23189 = NBRC 102662]|uniref:Phosphohydrolase n=2 Tax=Flavilitoribacter TaxID=2762562 RepID=A0A2D0NCZ2_FLAN2|nr:phosphohydrolase [Flavilitoribacter nigricans DSM 23189 = NBRC 102662]